MFLSSMVESARFFVVRPAMGLDYEFFMNSVFCLDFAQFRRFQSHVAHKRTKKLRI